MRMCEAKQDLSFIFVAVPRSREATRTWRPQVADRFDVVFPWHSYGSGLRGAVSRDGLDLEDMSRMSPAAMRHDAFDALMQQFHLPAGLANVASVAGSIFKALRKGGFAGPGDYVELCDGLFFPRAPLIDIQFCGVAVPTN